jgi:hypothetical protein
MKGVILTNNIARKFLFFDYWTYETISGFTRIIHKPEKFFENPVFTALNNQYEFNSCSYSTIAYDYDDSLFKMWYGTSNIYKNDSEAIKYLCYAESCDGFNWNRPNLNLIKGTNVVMDKDMFPMGTSVLIDKEDNQMRYKLIMRPKNIPKIATCFSKDGIHWKKEDIRVVINSDSDCKINLFKSCLSNKYYALFRNIKGQRKTYVSSSHDFISWDEPKLILEPDIEFGCQSQLYGTQATSYGNYVIGLSPIYNTDESDMNWAKMEGTMDIGIAVSKGEYSWKWLEPSSRFISLDDVKNPLCKMIHPLTSLIYRKNQILIYYSASDFSHGNTHLIEKYPQYINVAGIRPDGFVSIDANEKGFLRTRPFSIHIPEIFINADCSNGTLSVRICDAYTNIPIKGYDFSDCVPISTDSIKHKVIWIGTDKESITKRPIRIEIECFDAKIYSLFIPNGNDSDNYWIFDEINCVNPIKDVSDNDYFMRM